MLLKEHHLATKYVIFIAYLNCWAAGQSLGNSFNFCFCCDSFFHDERLAVTNAVFGTDAEIERAILFEASDFKMCVARCACANLKK